MTSLDLDTPGALHLVPIHLKVSEYALANIIIDAIEGGVYGIIYWCPDVELTSDDTVIQPQQEHEVWNWFIACNVARGGTLTFYEMEDEWHPEKLTPRQLTREKLLEGLSKTLMQGHFLDRIQGVTSDGEMDIDMDGPMADVIIQYALLGDVVYG